MKRTWKSFAAGSRMLMIVAVLVVLSLRVLNAGEEKSEHVRVTYDGIDAKYASAIASVFEAARGICVEEYGFDMPQTIRMRISAGPDEKVRLFNDGVDTFSLSVRNERDLKKPNASGIFHIYGICHEVAHLAMYRPIRNHDWLTTAGAEGWAHYLGSRIVDGVYAREGGDLWPDAYDYRADGTQRLQRQYRDAKGSETTTGAKLWSEFVETAGAKNVAAIFSKWGQQTVDSTDPGKSLVAVLKESAEGEKLVAWWGRSESTLAHKREKSGFASRTAQPAELARKPLELAFDDGRTAGKKSIAGSGHAVRFEAADAAPFVTGVQVFGSAYGGRTTSKDKFRVWLCDADFKAFAEFELPYSKFKRGNAEWVKLPITPTSVPRSFVVCVGFNPSATKGVYVHYDSESSGKSLTGLPGGESAKFSQGDWMIRVDLDQIKAADSLQSQM